MIVALPLDLPNPTPDNWDTFWSIWNTKADYLVKRKANWTGSDVKVNDRRLWIGMDILINGGANSYDAPYVNMESELPEMYKTLRNLPFTNLKRVRLLMSQTAFWAHTDDNKNQWSLRNFFYNSNEKSIWYFTKPGVDTKTRLFDSSEKKLEDDKVYLKLPKETNWFAYNDLHCWHGTDYEQSHKKILLQLFHGDQPSTMQNILKASREKYESYAIKFD